MPMLPSHVLSLERAVVPAPQTAGRSSIGVSVVLRRVSIAVPAAVCRADR